MIRVVEAVVENIIFIWKHEAMNSDVEKYSEY